MIFGGFKGFAPDRSWQLTAVVCCGVAELFCLVGYVNGFVESVDGHLVARPAHVWDSAAVAYTAGLWIAWGAGTALTVRAYRGNMRSGTAIMLALPVLLFLFLALKWVTLAG
jgi:hypothetical protein